MGWWRVQSFKSCVLPVALLVAALPSTFPSPVFADLIQAAQNTAGEPVSAQEAQEALDAAQEGFDSVDDDGTVWVDVELYEDMTPEEQAQFDAEIEAQEAEAAAQEAADAAQSTTGRPIVQSGSQSATATSLGLDLAEDSPKWCTFQEGTPTSTPITPIDDDGDDPRDTPPPGYDDGDDPRDVGPPPCEELRAELEKALSTVVLEIDRLTSGNTAVSTGTLDNLNGLRNQFETALEELDKVCPGDDGDDPRDTPPPDDDGDDPRDVKPPCHERIDDVTGRYKALVDQYAAGLKGAPTDWAQFNADMAAVEAEMVALDEECGDGDDPRDTQGPEITPGIIEDDGDDPRDVTVTVIVKATTSVLQDGSQVDVPQAGQMIKLIPSATANMDLPGEGVVQETSLDTDGEPMQGTTGADGWLPFKLDLDPRNWPANVKNNVGKIYDLLTGTRDELIGMGVRAGELGVDTCANGLGTAVSILERAANGAKTWCTDPGQAIDNVCTNLERGFDRLTGIGERIVDDPVGCVARGAETAVDTALGLLGQITGLEFEANVNTEEEKSVNVEVADAGAGEAIVGTVNQSGIAQVTDVVSVGERTWITLTYPASQAGAVEGWIGSIGGEIVGYQENYCRIKQADLDDPYMASKGSWGQSWADQWAIQRIGLTNDKDSAWDLLGKDPKPVIVAVIDTGLDWHHLDIDWENVWRNAGEIPDNGKDDDGNGYVDDIIGWDFFAGNNYPWDHDGHGTVVAGVIAAKQNNGHGIAGINPHAKIMVLKGMNSFGHTRASYLAHAITYAADNGADVINLSVGGANYTDIEQAAIDYAYGKGVTIIVAAGNEALDVSEWGTAGSEKVITVAATDRRDKRAAYSNFGTGIDIAAPGDDIMSLRARRTDTMRDIKGVDYEDGSAYVGDDKRYYRVSGTSFAAPIVAGVASLLLSKTPDLTPAQVKQILTQSAEDVEDTGFDRLTGHGLVDARAALTADVNYRIEALIDGVEVVQAGGRVLIQVNGTADADKLGKAYIEIGMGEAPAKWTTVINPIEGPVRSGSLGQFDAGHLAGSAVWKIRVVVRHADGSYRVNVFRLQLG